MSVQSRILAFGQRCGVAQLACVTGLVVVLTCCAWSQTLQVIHDFSGPDGENPHVGLIIDSGGRLYGTTFAGGAANAGVVYRLTRAGSGWTLNTLYTFQGHADGAGPMGRVVFGPDGALYGTTNQGGNSSCDVVGCGTVFKLQPPSTVCKTPLCPWTKTTIYKFNGFDGEFPVGDLTFDSAGNLYGVTASGGLNNVGVLYELSPSNGQWTLTIIDPFGVIYNSPEAGVTFGADGNIYGTLEHADGNPPCCYGAVYQEERTGSGWREHILYVLGTDGGMNDGGYPVSGVVFDAAGNLYGATITYGAHDGGTAFQLTPSSGARWLFSVLYNFPTDIQQGDPGVYGTLVSDQAGNLYGTTAADGANSLGNIFKFTPNGSDWSYTSLYDFNDPHVAAHPYSNVVFDSAGNAYGTVDDGGNSCGLGTCGGVWELTP